MRPLALIAAIFFLACAAPPKPAASHPTPIADLALPAVQSARVSYALNAAGTLAREWPWMTSTETCVLLVDTDLSWGLNCAVPPRADFIELPQRVHDQPVFARRGGTLNVGGQPLSGKDIAANLVASVAVDSPRTQLRDLAPTHAWLVISTLEALQRWHPKFHATSTEEWLSVFVHEFFHTRQLLASNLSEQLGRFRSSDFNQDALIALYATDPHYRALVEREHQLLDDAAVRGSAEARAALSEWRRSYERRRDYLKTRPNGELLVQADILFTYIEGVARYVENRFVVEPSQHPATPIPDDPGFARFAGHEGRGRAGMLQLRLGEFYYYALGFQLSSVLDLTEPDWKQRVHAAPDWLVGLALAD